MGKEEFGVVDIDVIGDLCDFLKVLKGEGGLKELIWI